MSGPLPELLRPKWAEETEGEAYELAVVVERPMEPLVEEVQFAAMDALRRLYANNPGKSFGAWRFARTSWGLYAQTVVVPDGLGVPLPPALPAALCGGLYWLLDRRRRVALEEGGKDARALRGSGG